VLSERVKAAQKVAHRGVVLVAALSEWRPAAVVARDVAASVVLQAIQRPHPPGLQLAAGGAALAVALTLLHTSDGQSVPIQTESVFRRADETHGTDAVKVGAGAAIGAAIGAIAGGGKGAAIGALVGVTAGAIGAGASGNNRDIELPSESALTFALTQRLTLKP